MKNLIVLIVVESQIAGKKIDPVLHYSMRVTTNGAVVASLAATKCETEARKVDSSLVTLSEHDVMHAIITRLWAGDLVAYDGDVLVLVHAPSQSLKALDKLYIERHAEETGVSIENVQIILREDASGLNPSYHFPQYFKEVSASHK